MWRMGYSEWERRASRRLRAATGLAIAGAVALWLAGCGALVTPQPSIHDTGVTTVKSPYATPVSAPLYRSDLTSATSGWASGAACQFTNQGLVVHPQAGQAYICLAPIAPTADLAVTVTVQHLSGSPTHAFGIVFRHASAHNYYFFGVDGHGRYTLDVVVNDVSHTIIAFTANPAIHTAAGATNLLQIIAQGQSVTLLINGTPVGQATLTTFTQGTVGLRGVNDGDVRFHQLVIVQA